MRLTVLVLALAAACDWTRFDQLSADAPVREIQPIGDLHPATFGDAFLGLPRPGQEPGAMIIAAGNPENLTTVELGQSGATVSMTAADASSAAALLGLDPAARLRSLSAGPIGPNAVPLVWVAAGNQVSLINPLLFQSPYNQLQQLTFDDTPLHIVTTDLGSGSGLDLAICTGKSLVLQPVEPNGVVDSTKARTLRPDPSDPSTADTWTDCASLAVGSLGGQTVLAVGSPKKNTVWVLEDPASCMAGPIPNPDDNCKSATVKLQTPPGALQFGAALLFAPYEGTDQLLVGAPGSNEVWLFDSTGSTNRKLDAPAGAIEFGAALAYTTVVGIDRLVVGAPGTMVDNVSNAGALYVYPPVENAPLLSLASPESGRRLGRGLGLVPFRGTQLLAAAGDQALYVFFNPLGGSDPRVK